MSVAIDRMGGPRSVCALIVEATPLPCERKEREVWGVFGPKTKFSTGSFPKKLLVCSVLLVCAAPTSLLAQGRSDATFFWGTSGNATSSPLESSQMHANNGLAAGQVNAALDGVFYEGSSISIMSIGSQNVISTSIIGNGNDVEVDAEQQSKNSGDVSNDGTVKDITTKREF